MLERSQTLPIILKTIRIERDKSEGNKRILFENLSRVRELGIKFEKSSDDQVKQVIGTILKEGEAPELMGLELESDSSKPSVVVDLPCVPSSLSSLTLVQLQLSFLPASNLSNLTHFSITFSSLFNTDSSVNQFYSTLECMPNLTCLFISDDADEGRLQPPSPSSRSADADGNPRQISFPHLQHLRFTGDSSTYIYLLRYYVASSPMAYHQHKMKRMKKVVVVMVGPRLAYQPSTRQSLLYSDIVWQMVTRLNIPSNSL